MFLSSVLVPQLRLARRAARLTLASTRSEPFSMSQSETPSATIVARSNVRKRARLLAA